MLQLATEPSSGQEQDVGGPATPVVVAASGASVGTEAGDSGGGEDAPQAASKIAVNAMAVQYPANFLWLGLNMGHVLYFADD